MLYIYEHYLYMCVSLCVCARLNVAEINTKFIKIIKLQTKKKRKL